MNSTAAPDARKAHSSRRDKTRARIIAAASELLRHRRVSEVTVEDMLVKAEISRRTFYQHFADKHEVAGEIVMAIWQTAAAHYAAFAKLEAVNRQTVRAWLETFLTTWGEDKDQILALVQESQSALWAKGGPQSWRYAVMMVGDGSHWDCALPEAQLRAYLLIAQLDRAMMDFHAATIPLDREQLLDALSLSWIRVMQG